MRKLLYIFCTLLATIGLTFFALANRNDSSTLGQDNVILADGPLVSHNVEQPDKKIFADFIYDIGPRFSGIKKTELVEATSIHDFFSSKEIQEIGSLKSVNIIVIKNEAQSAIREIGFDEEFTKAQLQMLRSFDYSTNFSIQAKFEKTNKTTGKIENGTFNPHLTIVPETQAQYSKGFKQLKSYLKENTKEALINVEPDKMRPAKLYFTVTKSGILEHVRLDNHSGYPSLDDRMIELISKLPGQWKPAENAKGEKVDQELVISFGLMGC